MSALFLMQDVKVDLERVFFAVKTCTKFQETRCKLSLPSPIPHIHHSYFRPTHQLITPYTLSPHIVPVVWETWAGDLPESAITYFSDFAVEKYRTVSLGVPNTEIGECMCVCWWVGV